MNAFEQGLRELGYIEGTNIVIERRYTDSAGNIDEKRLAELAAELVRVKPDVLVVSITEAALASRALRRLRRSARRTEGVAAMLDGTRRQPVRVPAWISVTAPSPSRNSSREAGNAVRAP